VSSTRPVLARLILWRGNAPTAAAICLGFLLARYAPGWPPWIILLAGLAVGGLFAIVFLLNARHTDRVEGLAAQLMRANHKLNAEIQQRSRVETELEAARDEALELSRLKSQFLATMSHEIRTPMNGIIGMTDLLLDTRLTDEQLEYAVTVRKCSENLMDIINDILDFAKIEAGTLKIQRQEFAPKAILQGAFDLLRDRALVKGLTYTRELSKDLPDTVIGDPARFRQMLVILIGNAIKFTERGEVFVSAEPKERRDGSVALLVSVHDTGIGVSPEKRARLFESFYQSDGSNTRKYGGAGLGLAICKQLAEKMGGDIEFESQQGRGSTFRLTVRLELPKESGTESARGLNGLSRWTSDSSAPKRPESESPGLPAGQTSGSRKDSDPT